MNIQATSIHDDIARYFNVSAGADVWRGDDQIIKTIAAGLERDYYYVPLADLPEVEVNETHVRAGHRSMYDADPAVLRGEAHELLALADHFAARESEAAVLARRRDELARELHESTYGPDAPVPGYQDSSHVTKTAIDRLIAAEAEVARLRQEATE